LIVNLFLNINNKQNNMRVSRYSKKSKKTTLSLPPSLPSGVRGRSLTNENNMHRRRRASKKPTK
jgi:hypothetical protein